jgi:hypothetical protein
MLWRYCDEAQRRQGVEAFCNSDVAGVPAGREITKELVGQHHDEGMGSCSCFAASEDRAHCAVCGFAGPKRGLDRR